MHVYNDTVILSPEYQQLLDAYRSLKRKTAKYDAEDEQAEIWAVAFKPYNNPYGMVRGVKFPKLPRQQSTADTQFHGGGDSD